MQNDTLAAIETALRGIPAMPSTDDALALRRLVIVWVAERKDDGWLPEQIIVEMKRRAAETGFRASPTVSTVCEPDSREELVIDLVLWCIEGYFAEDPWRPTRSA